MRRRKVVTNYNGELMPSLENIFDKKKQPFNVTHVLLVDMNKLHPTVYDPGTKYVIIYSDTEIPQQVVGEYSFLKEGDNPISPEEVKSKILKKFYPANLKNSFAPVFL